MRKHTHFTIVFSKFLQAFASKWRGRQKTSERFAWRALGWSKYTTLLCFKKNAAWGPI